MYRTSDGVRVLRDAEARLFIESLGVMVDHLRTDDFPFDVAVFDDLQRNQKIAVLHIIGRALLREDEPPPRLTAVVEGAVASVYQHMRDMLAMEIEYRDEEHAGPSWRRLVLDACREKGVATDVGERCTDTDEWEFLVDCLAGQVLWDTDWEAEQHLDIDPETSRHVKEVMGISDDYYVDVPPDPTDDEAERILAQLIKLTADAR